jgi:hypothetical protein
MRTDLFFASTSAFIVAHYFRERGQPRPHCFVLVLQSLVQCQHLRSSDDDDDDGGGGGINSDELVAKRTHRAHRAQRYRYAQVRRAGATRALQSPAPMRTASFIMSRKWLLLVQKLQ